METNIHKHINTSLDSVVVYPITTMETNIDKHNSTSLDLDSVEDIYSYHHSRE